MSSSAYIRGLIETSFYGRSEPMSGAEVAQIATLAYERGLVDGEKSRRELPPAASVAEITMYVRKKLREVLDPDWRRTYAARCPNCAGTYAQHSAADLLTCAEAYGS